MKTIQHYLKECDREAVANQYIHNYLFDSELMNHKYDDIRIGDLKETMKNTIYDLIDRLVGMEPEFGDDRDILMIIHTSGVYSWSDDDIELVLVNEAEVRACTEDIKIYDYSLTKHARMVSFYVADTYLTQHYLSDLIIQFLYEALYMGPEQEHLEEFIEELERGIDESNRHEYYSMEDVFKDMEERIGFEFEVQDKRQEEAERVLTRQRIEYDALCRKIEIEKLRDSLERE